MGDPARVGVGLPKTPFLGEFSKHLMLLWYESTTVVSDKEKPNQRVRKLRPA